MRTLRIDDQPLPLLLFSFKRLIYSLPVPTSSLTSKMDRVRSVIPSAMVMTFSGPLIVLDTQSNFDHIVGLNQIMIQIIQRGKQ